MKYLRFLMTFIFFLCAGCTHVISEESLRLVDGSLTFAQIKQNPDQQVGKYVLLGGAIASVSNTKGLGQLEVVQFQLDSDNMPVESHKSGGRFVAQSSGFLDPLVYKTGRFVTIVGKTDGHKVMRLDQIDYDYPVIAIRELYLWKPEETLPYPYPYYPPFYYDFYYDHWWRPYGPWRYR